MSNQIVPLTKARFVLVLSFALLMLNFTLPALLGAVLILMTALLFGFFGFWFDRWYRETHPSVD